MFHVSSYSGDARMVRTTPRDCLITRVFDLLPWTVSSKLITEKIFDRAFGGNPASASDLWTGEMIHLCPPSESTQLNSAQKSHANAQSPARTALPGDLWMGVAVSGG